MSTLEIPVKRPLGRPKTTKSPEERAAARNAYMKRYYEEHKAEFIARSRESKARARAAAAQQGKNKKS